MKTFGRIVLLPLLMISALFAQEDLMVRSLTVEQGQSDSRPIQEVLYHYDQQLQLTSELHLTSLSGRNDWAQDYAIDYEYDEFGRLIGQEKRFFNLASGQLQLHDRLQWSYHSESFQSSYQLIRTRPQDNTEEGFFYTYDYDNHACQIARTGHVWSQEQQAFIPSDRVLTSPDNNCLPLTVRSFLYDSTKGTFIATYSHRYEYEFDSLGRPLTELTYRREGSEGPEQLISEFRITYGENDDLRTFNRFTNGYYYESFSKYDSHDRPIYRLEQSNLYSSSEVEPTQETTWEYNPAGELLLKKRMQRWNQSGQFWESGTIDSVVFATDSTVRFKIRETWSAPGVLESRDMISRIEFLRCDGAVESYVEHSYREGAGAGTLTTTNYDYASPAPCMPGLSASQQIDVFPVPAHDRLHIRSSQLVTGHTRVRLLNLQGRTVLEAYAVYGNGMVLDVSGLPGGVYILMLDSHQDLLSKKILIE